MDEEMIYNMNKKSSSYSEFDVLSMIMPNSKRSQITIFIIIAILFFIAVVIIFLLFNRPTVKILDEDNPQAFVESCTRESVEEAIEILSRQGGDIKPKGFVRYETNDIAFLCYNFNYFDHCINQRPLLIEHIENEITEFIRPQIEDCFVSLIDKFDNRYEITGKGGLNLKTTLQPKTVVVEVNKDLKLFRNEEVRNFDDYKMILSHPIYNLAEIGMEIANQESRYCNFDELGYMILYPGYDITKLVRGNDNIIYVITDNPTEQKFTFAIQSCRLPPGF